MTLSVVLITFNEEANLARTLESVRWADEIVVVDSGSTDRTVEIARTFGAKVFVEEWQGFAAQKNSAMEKATCDWVLSLDADEELSDELASEMHGAMNSAAVNGYEVPRKNIIFGRWLRYGGNWPDRKLRLFRSGKGRVLERAVHEVIKVEGGLVGRLRSPLIHYPYPTLDSYIEHMQRYSTLAAQVIVKERKQTWFWFDVWLRPLITFKWRYFFRLGFLDGREGFLFQLYHAMYVSWKYAKAWEMTRPATRPDD